jgi:hypothetical protein
MADSWYDNAWNQLSSLKALRGACNDGIFGYTTLPPDTREICTIGDLNTYAITYKGTSVSTSIYNTFTSPNNNECFTTGEINIGLYFHSTPQSTACSFSASEELLYSSGTSNLFEAGCQLYTNRARTTTKTFSVQGWIYTSFGTSYEVSTAGIILNVYPC